MRADTTSQHEADTRDRFDSWSESYTFRRLRPWLAFVQQKVFDQIDWSTARRFLDVACGSGWAVFQCARRVEGKEDVVVCGCDISEGMLRQRDLDLPWPERLWFQTASAHSLPFADDTFDVILCTSAFHHFPDPAHTLGEFRRVLRPGGTALIADPCRDQSLGNWVWDRLHRWFEKGHVQYYRQDDLRSLLDDAGFQPVQTTALTPTYAEARKLIRSATLFRGTSP